jgi:hypothetical protein
MGEDGARVMDASDERFVLMDHDVLDDVFREDFDDDDPGGDDFGGSADATFDGGVREDEEFCEVLRPSPLATSRYRSEWSAADTAGVVVADHCGRSADGVIYAPERVPPLMDFLTVLTAFVVAVFAAYYSISL